MDTYGLPHDKAMKCVDRTARILGLTTEQVNHVLAEVLYRPVKLSLIDDGLYAYKHLSLIGARKVLGLDLDDTLLKRFSKALAYSSVPSVLNKYATDGWVLIVFTNQLGIDKGKETVEGVAERLQALFDLVGFRFSAVVAAKDNKYRKGNPDMLKAVAPGVNEFMYVGDAAGRPRDHSDTDAAFAYNVGLTGVSKVKFVTADHFFGKGPAFTPKLFEPGYLEQFVREPVDLPHFSSRGEVVLMVGYPGCGKSTVAKRLGLPIVSNDVDGKASALRKFKALIKEGKSVVVDNTNLTEKARAEYLDVVPSGMHITAIMFVATEGGSPLDADSLRISWHLNQLRKYLGGPAIPHIAYYTMRKNGTLPETAIIEYPISVNDPVQEYWFKYEDL